MVNNLTKNYFKKLGTAQKFIIKSEDIAKIVNCLIDIYDESPDSIHLEIEFINIVKSEEERRSFYYKKNKKEFGDDVKNYLKNNENFSVDFNYRAKFDSINLYLKPEINWVKFRISSDNADNNWYHANIRKFDQLFSKMMSDDYIGLLFRVPVALVISFITYWIFCFIFVKYFGYDKHFILAAATAAILSICLAMEIRSLIKSKFFPKIELGHKDCIRYKRNRKYLINAIVGIISFVSTVVGLYQYLSSNSKN